MFEDVYVNASSESLCRYLQYTTGYTSSNVHSKLNLICESTEVYSTVSKFLDVTFVF